jgi:predicted N-acetyltransferase YhbS
MKIGELNRVHRMLGRAFPNTPKSFFDRQVENDPSLLPGHTRIFVENGKILSCVRVYFRKIHCQGETVLAGGIGDVGTDPEYRGRGFASMLMTNALEFVQKRGAAFSLLFTHINPYYMKFGYLTLPSLAVAFRIPSRTSHVPFRRAHFPKDLTRLERLYVRNNRERIGPVVRNRRYWISQLRFPRIQPNLVWVSEKGKTLACTIKGFVAEDRLKVIEFGFVPGEEERLFDLMAAMARFVGKDRIQILHMTEEQIPLFSQTSPDIFPNSHIMIRPIVGAPLDTLRKIIQPNRFLFWEADCF